MSNTKPEAPTKPEARDKQFECEHDFSRMTETKDGPDVICIKCGMSAAALYIGTR